MAEGLDVELPTSTRPGNDTSQTITEPTALPSSTVVPEAANSRSSAPSHEPSEAAHLETTKELEEPSPTLAVEHELAKINQSPIPVPPVDYILDLQCQRVGRFCHR